MSGRGLLSRLEGGAGGLLPPASPQESIAGHLRVLLNTRVGEAATVPRFGVADFTDLAHQFPGAIQTLQQSIRTTLQEFEPRLKGVGVRWVPDEDPLTLRFEITAQLAEGAGRGAVRFSTVMAAGGSFEVW